MPDQDSKPEPAADSTVEPTNDAAADDAGAADATGDGGGSAAGGGQSAAPDQPSTPAVALPAASLGIAWLREWTTTAIAGIVVLVTMILLWKTYASASGFAEQKDTVMLILPILSAIIGFYFGRVPAERRAEAAEQQAGQAQANATQASATAAQAQVQAEENARANAAAEKKLVQAKGSLERVKSLLEPASGRRREDFAAGPPPAGGAVEAHLEAETALRHL